LAALQDRKGQRAGFRSRAARHRAFSRGRRHPADPAVILGLDDEYRSEAVLVALGRRWRVLHNFADYGLEPLEPAGQETPLRGQVPLTLPSSAPRARDLPCRGQSSSFRPC
jgi:hypothetical protein